MLLFAFWIWLFHFFFVNLQRLSGIEDEEARLGVKLDEEALEKMPWNESKVRLKEVRKFIIR